VKRFQNEQPNSILEYIQKIVRTGKKGQKNFEEDGRKKHTKEEKRTFLTGVTISTKQERTKGSRKKNRRT